MTSPDSTDLLRRDQTLLAASVSALTDDIGAVQKDIGGIKTQLAVRDERDIQVRDHLARIEKSLDALYSLGRWAFFAFAGSLIAAFVTFIVKGGMNVPPAP